MGSDADERAARAELGAYLASNRKTYFMHWEPHERVERNHCIGLYYSAAAREQARAPVFGEGATVAVAIRAALAKVGR